MPKAFRTIYFEFTQSSGVDDIFQTLLSIVTFGFVRSKHEIAYLPK